LLQMPPELPISTSRLKSLVCITNSCIWFNSNLDKPTIHGPPLEEISTLLNKRQTLQCFVGSSGGAIEIEWQKLGQIVGGTGGVADGNDLIQVL
jgi:hypothetical protein